MLSSNPSPFQDWGSFSFHLAGIPSPITVFPFGTLSAARIAACRLFSCFRVASGDFPANRAPQDAAPARRQGLAAGPLETGLSVSHTPDMTAGLPMLSVSLLMFAGCFWVAYWLDERSKGAS